MAALVRKYAQLTFERKTALKTAAVICLSAALACGKLVIGLFTDHGLAGIAVYTFAILLAKTECVLGICSKKRSFGERNRRTAIYLGAASILYIAATGYTFFVGREVKNNGLVYAVAVAFIAFCELGFAIAGVLKTKNRGTYYRNIKTINLCTALIAILTAQVVLLDMTAAGESVNTANAWSGIAVGCFTAICAAYIAAAPKMSVIGREHNVFELENAAKNGIVDMQKESAETVICRSFVYGDCIFAAKIQGNRVDGYITRKPSLWKRMPVVLKIVCCVLSEILVFAWLAGRLILFFRTADLPGRLNKIMSDNGFKKI